MYDINPTIANRIMWDDGFDVISFVNQIAVGARYDSYEYEKHLLYRIAN